MIILEIIEKLETARKNVKWLVDNPDSLIDFHGLVYWAGVVEKLRIELRAI